MPFGSCVATRDAANAMNSMPTTISPPPRPSGFSFTIRISAVVQSECEDRVGIWYATAAALVPGPAVGVVMALYP